MKTDWVYGDQFIYRWRGPEETRNPAVDAWDGMLCIVTDAIEEDNFLFRLGDPGYYIEMVNIDGLLGTDGPNVDCWSSLGKGVAYASEMEPVK